jgi:AcrR family transcriptional regulator
MPFQIAAREPKSSPRLDAETWIEAALDALAANGVEAVRVERLAKSLGVTKGSFYWHFKDRPALLDAMLQSWRHRATLAIIDRLESGKGSPLDRLKHLVSLPRGDLERPRHGADIEAAIRLWARLDDKAAACITEIDRLRLSYIQTLLTATERFSAEDVKSRAVVIYAYMQGLAAIGGVIEPGLFADCEHFILKP